MVLGSLIRKKQKGPKPRRRFEPYRQWPHQTVQSRNWALWRERRNDKPRTVSGVRLCYAAMPNLDREAGVRREDLSGQYIVPREQDPFDKGEAAYRKTAG